MIPEKRCPRCQSVIPPLANRCVQCGMEAVAIDDQRFSVVRKGQDFTPQPTPAPLPSMGAAPAEAARVQEGDRVWYCKIGGQTIGPVTAADIRDAFAKGQIDGNASVGIQGKKDWFPIRSLPQFADMVTGIGRPPTARPLPSPAQRGASLPSPQQSRRAPGNAVPRPVLAAPAAGAIPAAGHAQAPVGPIGTPTAGPPADPDDETQVVPPLPPPTAIPGQPPGGGAVSPASQHTMQTEIARLRRMVLALGVLSGVLLLSAASLLMLWLSA